MNIKSYKIKYTPQYGGSINIDPTNNEIFLSINQNRQNINKISKELLNIIENLDRLFTLLIRYKTSNKSDKRSILDDIYDLGKEITKNRNQTTDSILGKDFYSYFMSSSVKKIKKIDIHEILDVDSLNKDRYDFYFNEIKEFFNVRIEIYMEKINRLFEIKLSNKFYKFNDSDKKLLENKNYDINFSLNTLYKKFKNSI